MYTDRFFKSGAALKRAVLAGEKVTVFNPGPFGPDLALCEDVIEGPSYKPHTFYVPVRVVHGVIVAVKDNGRWRRAPDKDGGAP